MFFCFVFQWHALDRTEQSKYYDMARKEKELHMQLYPGWSARDNYAAHAKKKKTRKRPEPGSNPGISMGGGRPYGEGLFEEDHQEYIPF